MSGSAPTMIFAGTLIDGTGGPSQRQVAITIVDDRITAVGAIAATDLAQLPGAPIFDARHATVTPGLIDAHAHLAWGLDDQPLWARARRSPDGIRDWSIAAAQRCLGAGVTTVRDCGADGLVVLQLRDSIAAGAVSGPRVLAAGPAITTTGGHGEFIGVCADTIEEIRSRVRELSHDGVDFIKVMASGGSMDPQTDRRHAQYAVPELSALVEEAHALSRSVVAHCNATEAIRNAVIAGVDTIAHCNWLGAADGTIEYDRAVADRILERGIFVDLNLAATMRPLAESDGSAQVWSVNPPPANRWDLHRAIRERGGRLLFSSDAFGPGIAEFPALLARAVTALGIDLVEVVHRATFLPAQAIGMGEQLGLVRPGYLADLAMFDGDLTTDPAALTRCHAVWRSGRLVGSGGQAQASSAVGHDLDPGAAMWKEVRS